MNRFSPNVRLIGLWYAFVDIYPAIETLLTSFKCFAFLVILGTQRSVDNCSVSKIDLKLPYFGLEVRVAAGFFSAVILGKLLLLPNASKLRPFIDLVDVVIDKSDCESFLKAMVPWR